MLRARGRGGGWQGEGEGEKAREGPETPSAVKLDAH